MSTNKLINNINSRYFIINIKVLELDYKFTFKKINDLLIDWIEESLIKKYNKKLNWNIGIIYPTEFYLTTNNLQNNYNKIHLLENKVIKILIYIDNKIYPSFDKNSLLYTNKYDINDIELEINNMNEFGIEIPNRTINLNDIIINIVYLKECFNIQSDLFINNNSNFIDSISISGVNKNILLHELDLLKLGNKFINSNYINDFIYLKNIQTLGFNKLINSYESFNNFYDNLIYNS